MKKIIFLLASILLFTSCSNDEPVLATENNAPRYAVSLNAKIPSFNVENTPFAKSAIAEGDPIFMTMSLYKENGELISTENYDPELVLLDPLQTNNSFFEVAANSISFDFLLEAGKYHLSLLVHRKDAKYPNTTIQSIIATNYNTDVYGEFYDNTNMSEVLHNGGVYFNTVDLNIVALDRTQKVDLELQPMWSHIDINIKDAQIFEVPEGTTALQFVLNPLYYGFSVKNKLALYADQRPIVVPLDSIRANPVYNLRKTTTKTDAANNTIGLTVNYVKEEANSTLTVLKSQQLAIPSTSLENGNYYNISGNLGSGTQDMSISLGTFSPEDVVIEF